MARRIVIDAKVTLGLFLKLPYSRQVDKKISEGYAEESKLFAPVFWDYESITGVRARSINIISNPEVTRIVNGLLGLELQRIQPTQELHLSALLWADRIGHSKAYDSHYLAGAESFSAEFWTADQRLYKSVRALGTDWINLV
jgi:predicted nucleic acid-binding protein